MAKNTRYTEEEKQALIAKYNMEGRPPMTTWVKENGISYSIFKGYLEKAEGTSPAPVTQSSTNRTSGLRADLQQRFLETLPEDAIKNFLINEVDRLTARVKELEAQLAQFQE